MEFFTKEPTSKQTVLATLAYFDMFGIPLTRHELSEYLILMREDSNKIDIYLRESPLIKKEDGYLSLGLNKSDYLKKFENSDKYWKKVRRFQFLFALCPFVKLVCVCNSLCVNAANDESDIDLFVITKNNRLFMARLFLTVLTSIFGVRRHGAKIRKRFCLSFFVSENNMDLSKIAIEPYDIYLAYWIKTLQPVAGDYEYYEKFIAQNIDFLKKYFHDPVARKKRYFRKSGQFTTKLKLRLEKIFDGNAINSKVKDYQIKRATGKRQNLSDTSGTVIEENMLKFHDSDLRHGIRARWEAVLKKIF